MNGTVTIPNYGNATTEDFHADTEAPKHAIKARMLPAPTTIEETGLPEELLVQLLVRTLFTQGELTERTAGEIMKLPYRGHERIIHPPSKREIL